MQDVLNATDVRKDFGRFIDSVVREKPKVVKRNRDYFLSLSLNQAKILLKTYTFKARFVKEEDGSITATLDNFDLVVNAETESEAKKALAEELVEYTNEYFNEFELYFYSLNRQAHFPYVLSVFIQEDLNEVMDLIHA